jgi:hypothetical protein
LGAVADDWRGNRRKTAPKLKSVSEGDQAMSTISSPITITITSADLEAIIRRAVREELIRLLRMPVRSILDDPKQEGPDDPAGDELLLSEALAVLQEYKDKPEAWLSLEEFEAEINRAEAAGELPH